jgi:hypothetical protein
MSAGLSTDSHPKIPSATTFGCDRSGTDGETVKDIIHYFTPTRAAAASLGAMARQAFCDAFAHLYDPAPFERFLEEAYGPDGTMERGLSDPANRWQVAAIGDRVWRKPL